MIEIKSLEQFNDEINNCRKKMIVVKWYSPMCGPCKRIAPKFSELSKKYSDVSFLNINVIDNTDLTEKYNIGKLPAFMMFEPKKLEEYKLLNLNGELAELDELLKPYVVLKIDDDF